MLAAELGFDIVGTTMHGYTPYTQGISLPDYDYIASLVKDSGKPVIAEGGIWMPEQLEKVLELGVFAAVIGTAITRPYEITKRFTAVVPKKEASCE